VVSTPEESKASCKANLKSGVTGGGSSDPPPRQTTRQGGGWKDWYFEYFEGEGEELSHGYDDTIATAEAMVLG